jgi:hypothetical protein
LLLNIELEELCLEEEYDERKYGEMHSVEEGTGQRD